MRKEKGLTQTKVAEAAGITQAALSRYEAGRKTPNLTTMGSIADALGASIHASVYDPAGEGSPHASAEPLLGPDPRPGAVFPLGSYRGRAILWEVLAVVEDAVLAIAEEVVDMVPYHERHGSSFAYGESSLPPWLEYFSRVAFTDSERACIDRAFLFTPADARRRLVPSYNLAAKPTGHARSLMRELADGGYCSWWLAPEGTDLARVTSYGTVEEIDAAKVGGLDDTFPMGVRPALWLFL